MSKSKKPRKLFTLMLGCTPVPVYLVPGLTEGGDALHGRVVDKYLKGSGAIATIELESWDPACSENVRVLFHELLHVLEFNYGLELGEGTIRCLERVLPDLLTNNHSILAPLGEAFAPD